MSIKSKSSTSIPEASEQEKRLYGIAEQMGNEQLSAIQQTGGIQDLLAGLTPELIEGLSSGLGIGGGGDLERLLSMGGLPTDTERDLVKQQADEALAYGTSDIDADLKESLGLLRNELAPSRGLRPDDTPIVDRGLGFAKEALRQKSQLSRSVRGQSAQQLLDLPMRRQQFMADLSQRALTNRLGFLSNIGQQGLSLSSIGDPMGAARGLTSARTAQATTTGKEFDPYKATKAIGSALTFCYVAEVLYGKFDKKTLSIRRYVVERAEEDSLFGKFCRLYRKHGKSWAKLAQKYNAINSICRVIWDKLYRMSKNG